MPDLSGLSLTEARVVIDAAGLRLKIREDGAAVVAASKVRVRGQSPQPGEVADPGTTIVVVVPPLKAAAAQPGARSPYVVVIDPGHQGDSDGSPEPLGPGSAQTKPRVTGGGIGTSTGTPEYEITLQIATSLKRELERSGVRVIMTRKTNGASLGNVERAQMANKAKADLFIRIHADSSDDAAQTGISTLVPANNAWTGRIFAESGAAGRSVHTQVLKATGAADRGIVERNDLTGFNWSKVPVVLVETGFLSNPTEDGLLGTVQYQNKLARGMSTGVLRFLKASRR